jgi:SAM-dependent methyltransferase
VLEQPPPNLVVGLERAVEVRGWWLSGSGAVRAELRCDGLAAGWLVGDVHRHDLGTPPEEAATGRYRGFRGGLEVAGLAPGDHALEVLLELHDGTRFHWRRTLRVRPRGQAANDWLANHLPSRPHAGRSRWRFDVAIIGRPQHGAGLAASLARTFASLGLPRPDVGSVFEIERPSPRPRVPSLRTASSLRDVVCAATAPWLAIIEAGDVLLPGALELVAAAIEAHPGTAAWYGDHVEGGEEPVLVLKPAWSGSVASHAHHGCLPWFVERDTLERLLDETGFGEPGDDPGVELPMTIHGSLPSVGHLQAVLSRRAKRGVRGDGVRDAVAPPRFRGSRRRLCVVIPTRLAAAHLLSRCLDSLESEAAAANLDVQTHVVFSAPVGEAVARTYLRDHPSVRGSLLDGAFNWSAVNNLVAGRTTGELLLFLNDDVEPAATGWLGEMVQRALERDVAAVGAVLLYPSGRIQHAGVALAADGESAHARHMLRDMRPDDATAARLLSGPLEASAVTGACLLTWRSAFERVGGFDTALEIAANDIDYCLRLRDEGWRCVVASRARLFHHESLTRAGMSDEDDHERFVRRWRGTVACIDPSYNRGLRRGHDDYVPDARPDTDTPLARVTKIHPKAPPLSDTDHAWKQWGERDPYFAVITSERFRSRNLTSEDRREFFESGRSHARHVLAVARRHLDAAFAPRRILDFGCGVGRILVHFAEMAAAVTGVDVSPAMLEEARRECDARGLTNVTLEVSDDSLSRLTGEFDFIHSVIVFQHIEQERGRELLRQLLLRLAPGGIGALHFTYAKAVHADAFGQPPASDDGKASRWPTGRGLWSLLPVAARSVGQPGSDSLSAAPSPPPEADPEMQMNVYRTNELLFLIQRSGITRTYVEFTDHGGELGALLYFQRPLRSHDHPA